jgi:uncharacterized protein (TIGR02594 family)
MPRVPTYEREQLLRPANRQGIDVRASPEAFGAGVGRAMQNVAAGLGDVADTAQAWAEKEAVIRSKERYTQFDEAQFNLLNDPQAGYLNLQGKNAVDSRPNYETALEELRGKHGAGLTGQAAELYARATEASSLTSRKNIVLHSAGEWKRWNIETSDSRREMSGRIAVENYRNPEEVAKHLAAGRAELQSKARDLGWSPETLKLEDEKFVDGVQALVFERHKTDFDTRIDSLQTQVFNDPNSFDSAARTFAAQVDAAAIPDAMKQAVKDAGREALSLGVSSRMLQDDPATLMGSLGVAVASPDIGYGNPSLPAGMRNNNPGNIKFIGQGADQGVVGPSENTDQGDPQAVFATPEAGMRAAYTLASRKYQAGKKTANQLVAGDGGWTPGNTQAAANIARLMGIGPDDDLGLDDPDRAAAFMRALVTQEHGEASHAYSDEMILSAVRGDGPSGGAVTAGRAALAGSPGLQSHVQVAKAFLGAMEGQDSGALSSFIEKATGVNLDPRQTAWCAAWLNAVFQSQGIRGTGKLNARSFLDFGAETDQPTKGDVVVLSRGDPNGWQGHVGIFMGFDGNGNPQVLGGNQNNRVSVQSYSKDKVLGYRRPPSVGNTAEANERLARLPGGGPSGGMVVTELDPRLAGLSFEQRLQIQAQAQKAAADRVTQANAQRKAEYDAYNDNLELRTLTGDVTSEMEILSDPILNDADKASRLRTFRTMQMEASETDIAVQEYIAGDDLNLNPLDSADQTLANKVFEKLEAGLEGQPEEVVQGETDHFMQRTGIIPRQVSADMRRQAMSTDPTAIVAGMAIADRVERVAPEAWRSMSGGEDIRRDLASFQHLVNSRGFSSDDAAPDHRAAFPRLQTQRKHPGAARRQGGEGTGCRSGRRRFRSRPILSGARRWRRWHDTERAPVGISRSLP